MNQTLQRIGNRAIRVVEMSYRFARGIDYKQLNHHILLIHQLKDIDDILYKSSRCLKEIMDYDLFGFAMRDEDALDIWIDPKFQFNNTAFLDMIKSDMGAASGDCTLHHFDDDGPSGKGVISELRLERLLSYRLSDPDLTASVYLLPKRSIMPHQEDVIETIVKAMGASLSNCMNIRRLQNETVIDPLTRCYNRRAMDEFIDQAIANSRRYGSDLSVVMLDLDHFKKVNDTYGHETGDSVLRAVSRTILSTIRKCDYLVRYGGEEFVLIMPATKLSKAVDVADRLRRIIENLAIQCDGNRIRVTASFGVAELKKDHDRNHLFREIDNRLYDAKARGRNRIVPDFRLFSFENNAMPDPAFQCVN